MTIMVISGVPTEVLVAPDSFKGTFSSAEVATALARGLVAGGQAAQPCPVADGGEGTLAALITALDLSTVTAAVTDPLSRPIEAAFGVGGEVAVVETAAASGLNLVAAHERDPIAATTYGTGQLLAAAVASGARDIFLAVGGSGTTDGGTGAVRALEAAGGLGRAKLTILCDVRTRFEDAARVFGPQKGAGPEDVRRLSDRLRRQGRAYGQRYGRDPRGLPMTGAAGGLSGGLFAAFGAELVAGAGFVLDAIGFDARMRASRAVITGEGRLDRQSLVGKLVSEVATRARQAGVPCHAVVGSNQLEPFDARILDLQLILEAGNVSQFEVAGAKLADAIRV
jgi:glycerate 2-kinase